MKNDLEGVCQDCAYLEKIRPLFDEKDKEIERLNNIISELEDYLLCQLVSCPISIHKEYQKMYHKLKELKGDSSNV